MVGSRLFAAISCLYRSVSATTVPRCIQAVSACGLRLVQVLQHVYVKERYLHVRRELDDVAISQATTPESDPFKITVLSMIVYPLETALVSYLPQAVCQVLVKCIRSQRWLCMAELNSRKQCGPIKNSWFGPHRNYYTCTSTLMKKRKHIRWEHRRKYNVGSHTKSRAQHYPTLSSPSTSKTLDGRAITIHPRKYIRKLVELLSTLAHSCFSVSTFSLGLTHAI